MNRYPRIFLRDGFLEGCFYSIHVNGQYQGENYTGAPGDFAPVMQKKSPRKKKKKEPLKIAIDSNVKACSMLQI